MVNLHQLKNIMRIFANTLLLIFLVMSFDSLSLAEEAEEIKKISGGGVVGAGPNPVHWKDTLGGNKAKLTAKFTPQNGKKFLEKTALAVPLGDNGLWEGNLKNSMLEAKFSTILPSTKLKKDPTFFTGFFKQTIGGARNVKIVEPPNWIANEILQKNISQSHFFWRMNVVPYIHTEEQLKKYRSGVTLNGKSEINMDSVPIEYVPISYTPTPQMSLDNVLLLTSKKMRKKLDECLEQSGRTDEPNGNPYGFCFVVPNVSIKGHLSKEVTNQPCLYRDDDGNPPTPACNSMKIKMFLTKIEVNLSMKIYLPDWKEKNTANANVKNAWEKAVVLFEQHERQHALYYLQFLQRMQGLEKMVFINYLCNCEVTTQEFVTMIDSLRTSGFADCNISGTQWCDGDTKRINTILRNLSK
jgi:hypothetical protein